MKTVRTSLVKITQALSIAAVLFAAQPVFSTLSAQQPGKLVTDSISQSVRNHSKTKKAPALTSASARTTSKKATREVPSIILPSGQSAPAATNAVAARKPAVTVKTDSTPAVRRSAKQAKVKSPR